MQREVAAREAHGGEHRIRVARFPARKTLEEFDSAHLRGLKREAVAHLGTLDLITGKENVVFLGPPAPARRTWPSPWGSAPARPDTASRSPPPPSGSTVSSITPMCSP
ncbi:ATP-binding protein [Streptomyces griseofuscus]|uniref:ATP-binding protein n=1 Tax=Streptomyces griseofuscus TaxID=146922 RepID=UPI002467DB26|nr:ATP-binding protein [Streptomyces griseofuscus]